MAQGRKGKYFVEGREKGNFNHPSTALRAGSEHEEHEEKNFNHGLTQMTRRGGFKDEILYPRRAALVAAGRISYLEEKPPH